MNILFFEDDPKQSDPVITKLEQAGHAVQHYRFLPEREPGIPNETQLRTILGNGNFDAIVWDGQLASFKCTAKLVQTFNGWIQAAKRVFSKPMIAYCADPEWRQLQIAAGCTCAVDQKDAEHLLKIVARIAA